MKKTLTNAEVINIINALQKEVFTDTQTAFNIKFAWKLNKNTHKLMELNKLITDKLTEIEKEFADDEHSEVVVNENGEEVRQVKKEFLDEFISKRTELLTLPNEVDIDVSTVEEIGVNKINPAVLSILEFMIDEYSENNE